MAKRLEPVLKDADEVPESSPWRRYTGDIRIWAGLVLIPLILFTLAVVFDLGPKKNDAPAPTCDFAAWVGKPLEMGAVRATKRPYRFIASGGTLAPGGDPELINIELKERTVTKVWCG